MPVALLVMDDMSGVRRKDGRGKDKRVPCAEAGAITFTWCTTFEERFP